MNNMFEQRKIISDYWKLEAEMCPDEYNEEQLERMSKGLPPIDQEE